METPSSTRRVTRSQTLASVSNNNISMPSLEKGLSNPRSTRKGNQQQDRSVLFDITNDSPIVGLATGSLETPSSKAAKNRSSFAKMMTPGSGEALLRGQVKNLLQKVEEEAELSKLCLESRSFVHNLKGLVNSPAGLLAPTPANTPQVLNLSGDHCLNSVNGLASSKASSPAIEETLISETLISEVIDVKEHEESLKLQKSIITRSLLLDFSEKSDSCDDESSNCPSVLTHQEDSEIESKEKPTTDDDNASIWSIQVNASSTRGDDDEEEEFEEEEEEEVEEHEEEEDYNEYELVDELCEFISKISVNGNNRMAPKFEGKHTRFVYNSDDEIIENEVEEEKDGSASPSILHLNGLPTPKGKHIRFSED